MFLRDMCPSFIREPNGKATLGNSAINHTITEPMLELTTLQRVASEAWQGPLVPFVHVAQWILEFLRQEKK